MVEGSSAAYSHLYRSRWSASTATAAAPIGNGATASGHAASADIGSLAGDHVLSVAVFVDWLHFLAVALWFGGRCGHWPTSPKRRKRRSSWCGT